jgi:small conductance mechanosensitive channel
MDKPMQAIDTLQQIIAKLVDFFVNYSFQVLGAIIVLIAGAIVAHWAQSLIFALLRKRNFDITLSKFIASTVRIVIITFTVIISLGKFGITITPFIAALGAATFGASLAIQGPLSNYGAGLSIILGHPFVVGDTITVCGVTGLVQEVKLAATILTNEDGIRITIPNKQIVGEILLNSKGNKVAEGLIGVSYDDSPERAIQIISQALKRFNQVAAEPQPQIGIESFGDSAINISFRYWVPTVEFFAISYAVNLAVYKALVQAEVKIPFPQRDIHIIGSGEIKK